MGLWLWFFTTFIVILSVIFFIRPIIQGRKPPFSLKGIILEALGFYNSFNIWWLGIRGLTPTNVSDRNIATGKAWSEFCDALKAAGAAISDARTPKDALNQAEGYRYLSRLVRAGLENFMECADPNAPVLTSIVDGLRSAPIKIGSDNPDNFYQNAVLSSQYSYRVHGNLGSVNYLGFGTQSGQYGSIGGLATIDYKEKKQLLNTDDGNFEIILSAERPENCENWLKLEASNGLDSKSGDSLLIVRQTFLDRETEVPATIHIEKMNVETKPKQLSSMCVEDGLNKTSMLVAGASMLFVKWASEFQRHSNQLPLFNQIKSNKAGGDPNIRYYHSYWKVGFEEALVIDAKAPPYVDHWNFQLNNFWMESLDYRYHNVHVNKHTSKYLSEGRIRLIVSHRNPRECKHDSSNDFYGSWITTVGHSEGTMSFRWVSPRTTPDGPILTEESLNDYQPKTKLMPFKKLHTLTLSSV